MPQSNIDNALLDKGLAGFGLNYAPEVKKQLIDFVDLLIKWNRLYSLTSINDREQIFIRHIFDSLSLIDFLEDKKLKRIIDIGTGAGLPGVPLAICCPDREFVLLDSNTKKTRFIQQVVTDLGLKNITIETARAEALQVVEKFDCVLSRAVTSVSQLMTISAHLCAKDGLFLIMKGTYPTQELETVPDGVIVRAVESVSVPGLDAQRHIVCLQANSG